MAWLSDWKCRIPFTVPSGAINSNLSWYTFKMVLTATTHSTIFSHIGNNYLKIAITNSTGTSQLYAQVIHWDSSTKQATIIVRSTYMYSGSDNVFYLYWDASKSNNTSYIYGPTDVSGLWSNKQARASYYFNNHINDLSGYGHDLTNNGASFNSSGLFGAPCIEFSGSDSSYLSCPADTDFDIALYTTIEVVYKSNGTQPTYATLTEKAATSSDRHWWMAFTSGTEYPWFKSSGGAADASISQDGLDDTDWHYFCFWRSNYNAGLVWDSYYTEFSMSGYFDGTEEPWYLGRATSASGRYFNGCIAEFRFMSNGHGTDWALANYKSTMDLLGTWGEIVCLEYYKAAMIYVL